MIHVRTIVCLLLAALLCGCATDRQVISQAQSFHSELQPAVITDSRLAGYMQKVGRRIITAARGYATEKNTQADHEWMFSSDMQFHLVNSKTLNAFTTGGNHMYIYSELFQQARTEDELAAVMAHEFAHVYGRHVQSGMNRQYAILAGAGVAGAGGYLYGGSEKGGEYAGMAAGAALLAGQLVGMSYTRGDESEADQLGFEFYVRAGWDPARFGDFFQAMIDKGYDKGPEFLSDHPLLANRVAASKRWAAALPPTAAKYRKPPTATPTEFAALQKRAAQLADKLPNDKTLAASQKLLAAINRSCISPSIAPDQKAAEQEVLVELQKRNAPNKPR
jgi:predicted Zn-dependent protease